MNAPTKIALVLAVAFASLAAVAPTSWVEPSQAQTDAGVLGAPYAVTPRRLKEWSGGGGGGAPTDATYITQTPNGSLSAEQPLSALSTGIMRVATTTGVVTSLTDSAGIAANISDETGSGVLVFGTAPTTSLSATLGTDDTLSGQTLVGLNAGATIAQWEAVYVGASSTYLLADANGSGTFPAFGIGATSGTNGNPLTIVVRGTVRNDAWNWTPGGAIYLSATPGALTQTAPSTSGDNVQVVGRALTADIAFFDFNSTYVTVE